MRTLVKIGLAMGLLGVYVAFLTLVGAVAVWCMSLLDITSFAWDKAFAVGVLAVLVGAVFKQRT